MCEEHTLKSLMGTADSGEYLVSPKPRPSCRKLAWQGSCAFSKNIVKSMGASAIMNSADPPRGSGGGALIWASTQRSGLASGHTQSRPCAAPSAPSSGVVGEVAGVRGKARQQAARIPCLRHWHIHAKHKAAAGALTWLSCVG